MKICRKCSVLKDASEFYIRPKNKDGLFSYCKPCTAARRKQYHAEHGERTNANRRRWYRENAAKICAYQSEYSKRTPRQSLNSALWRAIKRAPATPGNVAVTSQELMDIWTAQGGRCALSGVIMTWNGGKGRPEPSSMTIDRIDQSRGYETGNVRLLCHCINGFRGTMTDVELLSWLKAFHVFQFPTI